MKNIRLLLIAWVAYAALSISGHTATLDGAPPAFGSSVSEIRNDDILEKAELYKRANIRSVTITNPVSVNAIVATSVNVTVTSLSDGLESAFIAGATNTGAVTYALDGNGTPALTDAAGGALPAGAIVSGSQYKTRYVAASSQWRLISSSSATFAVPGPIGSTTASTGAFTTLTASGAVTLSPASAAVAISPTGTGTVAISPVGALTINPTAASTINNTSIGVTTPAAVKATSLTLTNLVANTTAPTVSGFCTTPAVPANNGNAAFTINVGTACAASTGTITLPAATTGWVCDAHDVTTPASNIIEMTGGTTTTVVLQNYVRTTGVASNFTSSDVIRVKCSAY